MSSSLCTRIAALQESTAGTLATGTYIGTEYESGALNADSALIIPKTNNGQVGDQRALCGPINGGGSFAMLANPGGINARFIKGLLPNVGTVDLGGGAYQHTFTPGTGACGTPTTFSVYHDMLAIKKYFTYCVLSKMNLSGSVGDVVKVGWDVLYQNEQITASAPTITLVEPQPPVWSDVTVTLDGVAFSKFEDYSMSIDRAAKAIFTHSGNRYCDRIIQTDLQVTGEFSLGLGDSIHQARYYGADGATTFGSTVDRVPLVISYVTPIQIGSSGQYYTLTFTMPEVVYEGFNIEVPNRDEVMSSISFKALLDDLGDLITVTLINNEATI